jgi:hypothetical protein
VFRPDPEHSRARGRRRFLGSVTATIGVLALVLGFLTVGATTTEDSAVAASGSDFNAGNIISDAVFYNSGTMSQSEIQSFLNSKVPTCRSGYTCLKSYTQATASQSAKREGCAAYSGSSKESAAAIIKKVATACGINPQVILVLLEKEQALISDTWPSARQYRSATGYGCPDTADCDASYYGFFNQVYNAAYQFKKYQASPNSRGYVAGKWNTIQWSPNSTCGSSSVYIENQATAALYIYTPYRPNEAALANMYGTGDGCSAYGNRNFWRMFTDWFGDTKGGSSFVRDASTGAIYLITGTTKHYVPSTAIYNALAKLGTYRNVSSSYLTGYTTGTNASPLVRNPLTGDIALVQGNSRHRFTSCGQVSVWGYDCGSPTDLMPGQWTRIPQGGEVSNYMVVAGTATTYFLNSSTRFPVAEWTGVVRLNGGTAPWVGTMSVKNAQRYPIGRTLATPGTAIKSSTNNDIFLVDGFGSRIRVPNMAMLTEYGLKTYKTVAPNVVNGYTQSAADLTLVATCNSALVLVNSGKASPLTANNGAGIGTTPLAPSTCSGLGKGATIKGLIFAKTGASPYVYVLLNGAARQIHEWSDAVAINGGSAPTIVTLSSPTIRTFAMPGGVVASGSLIKASNNSTVYLADGTDRITKLPSFGISDGLGIGSYRTVPASVIAGYAKTGASLSRVVNCAGAPYIGLNGTLYKLSATSGIGLPVTDLRGSTCSTFTLSKNGAIAKVFVKEANKSAVYYITGGKRRLVGNWSQAINLNGGSAPQVFTIRASEMGFFTDGGPMK